MSVQNAGMKYSFSTMTTSLDKPICLSQNVVQEMEHNSFYLSKTYIVSILTNFTITTFDLISYDSMTNCMN